MTARRLALPLAAALLALAAPPARAHWGFGAGVHGNGQVVTEERALAPFQKVRLECSLDVRVKVGAPQAVRVVIDSNVAPLVTTRVDGDTLVIDLEGNVSTQSGRVEVTVPALRGLTIDGSGDATIEGGQGDLGLAIEGSGDLRWKGEAGKLDVSIGGSGDVRLEGKAETLTASIEGSGTIAAAGLRARNADVRIDGSGDMDLELAGGSLAARISGSGDIRWGGEAHVTRVDVSGSGEFAKR